MTRGLLTATVRSVLTAGLVSAIGGIAGVLGAQSTKAAEPDTPKAAAIVQSTPSDSGRGWPIVVSPYVWAASLDRAPADSAPGRGSPSTPRAILATR